MATLVVEVADHTGRAWDEVSRYDADGIYSSSRHVPPKSLTGHEIAMEDQRAFAHGYGRKSRVREL